MAIPPRCHLSRRIISLLWGLPDVTIFAVHLSDGVLQTAWWAANWPLLLIVLVWSARRLDEVEIPRLGVLSAAFFVASQVHLPLGGVSVHLLLNGLVGVILARRAPLAIFVGLLLQAAFFGHGGWSTLAANAMIYTVPPLLVGLIFRRLFRSDWFASLMFRRVVVGLLALLWLTLALFTLQWSLAKLWPSWVEWSAEWSSWWIAEPSFAAPLALLALVLAWLEPRLERSPLFPLGLALGAFTGFGTVGLNALTLLLGSRPEFAVLPGVVILAHLPIIVIESFALGFIVVYLHRALPEWLQ